MMNRALVKSELIVTIANKQQALSQKDIEMSVNHLLERMSRELSDGGRIEIRGYGSFSLHRRPPRNARNPKTGEKVATLAKYTPHFKPGKDLRERVNANASRYPLTANAADDQPSEDLL